MTHAPSEKRLEDFVGVIVAAYLLLIGAVVLSHTIIIIEPRRPPVPFQVIVELPDEPPPEEPPLDPSPVEAEEPPLPEDVAATRRESTEEGELLLDPAEGEQVESDDAVFEEQTLPKPATIEEWIPNTDQLAEIRALTEEEIYRRESLDERKNAIAEKLIRMEVRSAARDFELNSDGGIHGAVRLFDVEGFPEATVKQVLGRYDIVFERRYVRPQAGRNFLNAASTTDGTYTNRAAEGYYDVLVFPAKTLSMLAVKETSALMDKGYDPRGTRIRKIVFGIIKNQFNEFDLDVVDLEVERIR